MNKTMVVILVLVALVYFLLVGGGVWRHSSESKPDVNHPPKLGTLGDLLSGFSPRLDVDTLRITSGAGTLEKGLLTLNDSQVTIPIPVSKESVRRLDLKLKSGPDVKVLYKPSPGSKGARKAPSPQAEPLPGTEKPSLQLAFTEEGGLLTISRPFTPGSEPSEVAFK